MKMSISLCSMRKFAQKVFIASIPLVFDGQKSSVFKEESSGSRRSLIGPWTKLRYRGPKRIPIRYLYPFGWHLGISTATASENQSVAGNRDFPTLEHDSLKA